MSGRSEDSTPQRLTVPVAGMTCTACERRVRKALLAVPGVDDVDVSVTGGSATVRGGTLPTRADLAEAIRSAGYEPTSGPWLSRDGGVWWTVLGGAVAVSGALALFLAVGVPDVAVRFADPSRGGMLVALVLGLAAGFSTCMALIGGLVLGFSANHATLATSVSVSRGARSFLVRMRPHLAFNAGRVVGFALLGALLGGLGSTLSLPTRALAALVLAVAAVMFLLGVRLTGVSPRLAAWSPRLPTGFARILGVGSPGAGSYSHLRTALIGAATFFLPCGFTQAVQLYALSTTSPLLGGAVMATFAVGTTPGLFALGAVPKLTSGRRQITVLRVVGVAVLAFAILNATSGIQLLGLRTGSATAYGQTVSDNVTVSDGAQVVRMTQLEDGYEPSTVVLYAGIPTTWAIEGTSRLFCSAYLRVPSLGLEIDLAPGENAVALPALEEGVVPFTCVMGMYSGKLVAIDPPPNASSG